MMDPSKKCSYTCRIIDGGEAPIVSSGYYLSKLDNEISKLVYYLCKLDTCS